MTQETKYGVISDVHRYPQLVSPAIEILKQLGAQKLIINGDIGERKETLQQSQNYVAAILDAIGKSGLESFVQPVTHETISAFKPVIEDFSEKYPNIIDATKNQKLETPNHSLVFLPGSDFPCSGEGYILGKDKEIRTGEYVKTSGGIMRYTNMRDLQNLVTDPEKTIVVCHVPRKFNSLEKAVDMAEFGIAEDTFDFWNVEHADGQPGRIAIYNQHGKKLQDTLKENAVARVISVDHIYEGSIFPVLTARNILKRWPNMPINITKENRGNEFLQKLYEELGITKAVSGHFHESGHRAHDEKENLVEEGKMVMGLFWNSGHFDAGQTGILTVNGNEASYQNILIQDYLKKD